MSIYTKTLNGWEEIGVGEPGLPGLGGWATITSVWDGSGAKPNRYAYPAGNPEWVAFEWTDTTPNSCSVTTSEGLVDVLVCAGGTSAFDDGGGTRNAGNGGNVSVGVEHVTASTHDIQVGGQGTTHAGSDSAGKVSRFDDIANGPIGNPGGRGNKDGIGAELAGAFGGKAGVPDDIDGVKSSITGSEVEYGRGGVRGGGNGPAGTYGWGGYSGTPGAVGNPTQGVVIVRVPAAQAAGVPASEYVDVP